MASCEKCWSDSNGVEEYHELLKINKCTPEEQAGTDAEKCPHCDRMTIHQIVKKCVLCSYSDNEA